MKNKKLKSDGRLLKESLRGNKGHLAIGALAMMLAVCFAYAIPLVTQFTIDYVLGTEEASLPAFIMRRIDALGGREYMRENIYICAIALVALTVGNGIFTFLRGREIAVASEGVARGLRDNLYSHLQNVPFDYHKHVSTGDLVQRCTSDVDTVRRFIATQLLEIVRTVAMMVVAAWLMLSIDTRMALISMAVLPILCLSSFIYFKKVRSLFTDSDVAEGELSATLQENLTAVRVVRAFGQQQSEVEKFTERNRVFRDKTYKLIKMLGFYWGFSDSLGYIQIGGTICFGVYFAVLGELSIGELLVFATYTNMLTWPVRQLGRVLADLGKASVSLGRLNEIMDAPLEKEPGKALTPTITGAVEFENVCFGYESRDDVLKDISFSVKPGQTVAILGSTGSGKTSLVQLLQRLYLCTGGRILLDSTDINDVEHSHLRRNLGIVLQEPFLYSRTIMENIRMGNPDATDEEVYEAAKLASVHDVILSFEKGYDTVVGERGVTLSGGQKQRVAIARMLLQNASILIFDDSLSAVDTETDAAIRRALHTIRDKCTMFIISHRIVTLAEADFIIVLEDGKLVQQGTHHELVNQEGLYRRIAEIQHMLEAELKEGGDSIG